MMSSGFAQKMQIHESERAKGAEYDSQGQEPNNVRRVGPGKTALIREALKERNNWLIFRTFSALFKLFL